MNAEIEKQKQVIDRLKEGCQIIVSGHGSELLQNITTETDYMQLRKIVITAAERKLHALERNLK